MFEKLKLYNCNMWDPFTQLEFQMLKFYIYIEFQMPKYHNYYFCDEINKKN